MRPTMEDQAPFKVLCDRMVERCDEYLELRSMPERGWEADEVKEEIKGLYLQISRLACKN